MMLENGVQEEVQRLLRLQLPPGVTYEDIANFNPNHQEVEYFSRLVTDIVDLGKCHPFDLFKIILQLVENDSFTKITIAKVKGFTMNITVRHSETRKKIRAPRLAKEQLLKHQ